METSVNNRYRAFTSIEQSKKLAEILPLESADMYYWKRTWREGDYAIGVGHSQELKEGFEAKEIEYIPCWSLVALLGVLEHPRVFQGDKPIYWFCGCFAKDNLYHEVEADNPVDACYEMIIKLSYMNGVK